MSFFSNPPLLNIGHGLQPIIPSAGELNPFTAAANPFAGIRVGAAAVSLPLPPSN